MRTYHRLVCRPNLNGYDLYDTIGRGGFGAVLKARCKMTDKVMAVKVFDKTNVKSIRSAYNEMNVLDRITHLQHVISAEAHIETEDRVFLTMEHCMGGDLFAYAEKHGGFTERQLADIATTTLRTLKDVHACGVVVGDLKPSNICLKAPENMKIALGRQIRLIDFGCSQFLDEAEDHRCHAIKGTPNYLAPEVLNRSFGPKLDVWSLGVTLFWLYTRRLPNFETLTPHTVDVSFGIPHILDVMAHRPVTYVGELWRYASPELIDFLSHCIMIDEDERMSTDEALEHPWITKDPARHLSLLKQ